MKHQQFSIEGKVIVLTGACGLLGRAISNHCAKLGARVACLDLNEKALSSLQGELGAGHVFMACDVSDKSAVERAFGETANTFGKVDVLINAHQFKPDGFLDARPETHSQDLWDSVIKANLTGTFYTCQEAAKVMIPQEQGVIINFASTYAVVSPNPELYEGNPMECPLAYVASKGAVISMSRQLAIYWAPHNIRVNCVTPHGVYDNHDDTFVERFNQMTPIERMMKPEEILGAIVYLASDASSYVTGTNMLVEGGWTVW